MRLNNFLAIDTSGEHLSVIACKDGKAETVFEENCAMQHSVRLMDAVDEALLRAHLSPEDCDFFCAVTGPGSFTGIRIGISAAKGFCAAEGKPALGITSFETLAYNTETKALAAIPAGRGNFYVCGFAADKSILLSPQIVGADELARLAGEYTVCAAVPLFVPYFKADPAAGLLRAICAKSEKDLGDLAAFYLKKSQAEENAH